VDTGRMVVGYIAMLILILILAPMPNSLWDSASDPVGSLTVRRTPQKPPVGRLDGHPLELPALNFKLIEDFRKCHNLRVRSPLAMDHWTVRRHD
jgi:hypothetical protein